jgi:biotin-(acetyl-CoA carboxylase) ligase
MRGITKGGDLLLEDALGEIKSVTTGDVNLIGFSNATRD